MTTPKSPAPPGTPAGHVVSLQEARRRPSRAGPLPMHRRIDELLGRPDAAQLVRRLPPQELFFALKETGLADAIDLLHFCSPDQVQAFLDLDCWQKDRLDPERTVPWFEALLELGPERLGRIVQALDHEFLVTFLQSRVRVYDPEAEEPPEEPEGHFHPTPDRLYVIDILPQGPEGHMIDRLLDNLYRADPELGRRVVMGVRWDVGIETEEAAYRFRSGRMADLGYVEYYEALKIYTYLDPHTVHLNEELPPALEADDRPSLLPGALADALRGDQTLLGQVLDELPHEERAHLQQRLLHLMNWVMSADLVEPGDLATARLDIQRAACYVSLGLEYLSRPAARPDEPVVPRERARQALRTVAPQRLFRLGFSLTVQLARLAAALVDHGLTSLAPKSDPASLLSPPHAQVLRLLLPPTRPPAYSRLLDVPPVDEARPFATLADIARCATALEEIAALGRFLTLGLGVRQDTLAQTLAGTSPAAAAVRLTDIVGTLAANLLLRRPPSLVPLARADLPALRQAALGLSGSVQGLSPVAENAVLSSFRERVRERSLDRSEEQALWTPAAERLLRESLARLGASLSALPADIQPEQADVVPSLPGVILG